MPVLKLDLNEVLPPACIRETLLQIPVPREIFFQSNQETQQSHLEDSQQDPDQMRCYSARLPLSSDDGLGLKNWLHQSEVVIRFPIQNVPLTDDETLTLLKTWALAPYWNEERNAIIGNIVPDDLCMQCMGGPKSFFKDLRKVKEASPPMWP